MWAFLLLAGLVSSSITTHPQEENKANDKYQISDESSSKETIKDDVSIASEVFHCSGKVDGYQHHDLEDRSKYYRCYQDTKLTFQCGQGYVFNSETSKCEKKTPVVLLTDERKPGQQETTERNDYDIRNDDACFQLNDGYHVNFTNHCQGYFKCDAHRVVVSSKCSSGFRYDVRSESCLEDGEVPCIQHSCPITHKVSKLFQLSGTDCKSYFKCQRSRLLRLYCPRGLKFDNSKQRCVLPSYGTCSELSCEDKEDGHHYDITTRCQRYFTCTDTQLNNVSICQDGFVFDGRNCVDNNTFHCPNDDVPSELQRKEYLDCLGKPEGYYPDVKTSCKKYYLCRNGLKIVTLKCPIGQTYDGRQCKSSFGCAVPDNIKCFDLEDGYHTDTASGCSEYFYCRDETVLFAGKCVEGTLFNGKMCVPHPLVKCSLTNESTKLTALQTLAQSKTNMCSTRKDGYHIDYLSGCKDYYYCFERGLLFRSKCDTPGQVFDGKNCVDQSDFMCEGPMYSSQCFSKKEGLYQDLRSQCQDYYFCSSSGYSVHLQCPPEQLFNGTYCVNRSEYMCQFVNRNNNDVDSCVEKQDGYYQDSSSACRSYYFCSRKLKATYVCRGNYIFNGKECVSPLEYSCPYPGSRDCQDKSNGYYTDTMSDCHNYYYCLKEQKVATFNCKDDKMYDGNGCVEQSEFTCPNGQDDYCFGKNDGYYPNPDTSCRTYYECKSAKKVKQEDYSCLDNEIFNGTKCTNDSMCPSKQPDCTNGTSGFYPDLYSNCRIYYSCMNGVKSEQRCLGDKIFNGELCVLSSEYQCPNVIMSKINIICKDKQDGSYQHQIKSNCKKYYRCSNGILLSSHDVCSRTISEECFNGTCLSLSNDNDPCLDKPNGIYPNMNSNCSRFYLCLQGQKQNSYLCSGVSRNYRSGLLSSACPTPRLYQCNEIRDEFCPLTDEIAYVPDYSKRCKNFFYCSKGQVLRTFICPEGMLFHEKNQICQINFSVKCDKGNSIERTLENNLQLKSEISCDDIPEAFYPNLNSGCREFYNCTTGTPLISHCPVNTSYDYTVRSCLLSQPGSINCPNLKFENTHLVCGNLPDGIYPISRSYCQSFRICFKQKLYLIGSCRDGKLYDHQTRSCRDYTSVVCPTKQEIS